MKIIIDDKIPFMRGQAERLGTAVYLPGAAITADDDGVLIAALSQAEPQ